MSFINPLLLLGLLFVSVPILIHLLSRQRVNVHPFAAMEFIMRSHRRTVRRFRFKQALLLMVRVACVAAAAFALSKPFLHHGQETVDVLRSAQPSSTVFLIDNSRSMGFRTQRGSSLLDLAVHRAMRALDGMDPDDNAAVMTTVSGSGGRDPGVVPLLSFDGNALKEALSSIRQGEGTASIPNAIQVATDVLSPSDLPVKRVVVFTDGTRGGWRRQGVEWTGRPGVELVVVDVAQGEDLWNRAVVGVRVSAAPRYGSSTFRIDADIANYSRSYEEELPVSLELDGQLVSTGFVSLEPRSVGTQTFYHTLPDNPASRDGLIGGERSSRLAGLLMHTGRVIIPEDPLASDNSRPFVLERNRRISVLAINGQPRSIPRNDELYFLRNALGAGSMARGREGEGDLGFHEVIPERLAGINLADFNVVVLANVARLEPERVVELERFVQGGGGLLITAGDNLDPAWYNQNLSALLPQGIRDVHRSPLGRYRGDVSGQAAGGHGRPSDTGVAQLALPESRHLLFGSFAGEGGPGLLSAEFFQYLLLEPVAALDRETLLRFSNGLPALVERSVGKGRVMMFVSSIDRDWNDLPIRTGYLPLLHKIVRQLGQQDARRVIPTLTVGQTGEASGLPPWAGERVRLRYPDGRTLTAQVRTEEGSSKRWITLEAGDRQGFITVESIDDGMKVMAVPVGVDPLDSDLSRVPPETLATSEGLDLENPERPAPVQAHQEGGRRMDLWPFALLLLVLLLLGEALLLTFGGMGGGRRRERHPGGTAAPAGVETRTVGGGLPYRSRE